VQALLEDWQHPYADRWLDRQVEQGTLPFTGEPPTCLGDDLWQLLLSQECDKLYNQAWCALDQIQSADDPESVTMLAMDDLPSAVEQAWALAPDLADEHLELLRQHNPIRVEVMLADLGAGTEREPRERAECLSFWEDNAEGMTDYRRRLFRAVREGL
jgi:hypothetical protein